MPNHSPEHKASGAHLLSSLALVVLAVTAVVIIAIFFRPGGFSVEGGAQGATIKLAFNDSRVDLSEFFDKLFKKAENGTDADRRLVSCDIIALAGSRERWRAQRSIIESGRRHQRG